MGQMLKEIGPNLVRSQIRISKSPSRSSKVSNVRPRKSNAFNEVVPLPGNFPFPQPVALIVGALTMWISQVQYREGW